MANNLLQYFDVIKYLEDRKIDYTTAGKNVTRGWVEVASPYTNDKSMHLGINLSSKIFSCWLTGEKGPITKLIQKWEGCSRGQVDKIVAQFTDFTLVSIQELRARKASGTKIMPANAKPVRVDSPPLVHSYLAQRNYTLDTAQKYDCHVCEPMHLDQHWKFRLIIPVYQEHELVTFIGRDMTGQADLRYKNNPEERSILPAKSCIYGLDDVQSNSDILVVEGIFDKWRLTEAGIPNVVSTLGTMTTKEQHFQLSTKNPKKIWVLFDANASQHAESLIRALPFCQSEVLILDGVKDPDMFGMEEIQELKELLYA